MYIIPANLVSSLNIPPAECVKWVKESFSLKSESKVPAKISLHPQGDDFFNTMPCVLPPHFDRFGAKIITRIAESTPLIQSYIFLYEAHSGKMLAMCDGDWITNMRTGAVACLAIQTFGNNKSHNEGEGNLSFIGLGNTARATLLCLLDSEQDSMHNVQLLRYKNQAELFIERFKNYNNVNFQIFDNVEDMICNSDVVVSSVTQTDTLICENDKAFKPGCLVVPIHTRGFQNCDLTFDKVFADDTDHVHGFKYFSRFKYFGEIQDVIDGKIAGRESEEERILSYNIGLGLHDIVFANKIYEMCTKSELQEFKWKKETQKFWI